MNSIWYWDNHNNDSVVDLMSVVRGRKMKRQRGNNISTNEQNLNCNHRHVGAIDWLCQQSVEAARKKIIPQHFFQNRKQKRRINANSIKQTQAGVVLLFTFFPIISLQKEKLKLSQAFFSCFENNATIDNYGKNSTTICRKKIYREKHAL